MALRVYRMQAGIAGQLLQGPEVIRRVVEVLGAAREGGFPVFFSRHVSLPKELMGASLAQAADGLAARGPARGREESFPARRLSLPDSA
jgi:hypothetical protein